MTAAAGVNYADLLATRGRYQVRLEPPFTPGVELSGVVEAVGPGVDANLIGTAVMAVVPQGAYAETVIAPAAAVFTVPPGVDLVEAAGLPVAFGTAHGALSWRARLDAGQTLVVTGAAGATGCAAVQVGKAMGGRVIALASTDEKRELVRAAGADIILDSADVSLRYRVREVTEGRGADVVFDPVGGPLAAELVRTLAFEGRYLVIGFAGGVSHFAGDQLLVRNAEVMGFVWGEYALSHPGRVIEGQAEIAQWLAEGRIDPAAGRRWPLSEAASALRSLQDRSAVGKQLLVA
jgi:NADPH2:quinone reductase